MLSVEAQLHLPSYEDTSVLFLREVIAGRKQLIKLKDLIPCNVPRMTEFNADVLYRQALNDTVASMYLPDPTNKGARSCSRKFLFNVRLFHR